MPLPPSLIPITLAGILNFVLGALLMTMHAGHRATRAFAAVMVLRAGSHLHFALVALSAPLDALAWTRAFPYLGIWISAALGYFLACYPAPRRWLPRGGAGVALFALPALAGTLLLALRHDLVETGVTVGHALIVAGSSALFGLAAFVLARDAFAMPTGRTRTSTLLIAAGFFAVSASDLVGAAMSGSLRLAAQPAPVLVVLGLAWVLVTLATFALALRDLRAPGALPLALTGVASAGVSFALQLGAAPSWTVGTLLAGGLLRLILPLLVAYALLRTQIFDLDVRVQKGLGRALVLAVFVVLFFAASEATERLVSERLGAAGGLAAALLLVVALRPLERAADAFARRLFPHAQDAAALDEDARLDIYRDLARTAYASGAPGEGERRVLEAARIRLRVDEAAARRIEAGLAEGTFHASRLVAGGG